MSPSGKTICVTHSAISVVSAFASGMGAAIGIGIPCKVSVEIKDRHIGDDSPGVKIVSDSSDPHDLVRKSVSYSLKYLRVGLPKSRQILINIDSKIPVAVGLKSSSAVSVGVVNAIFDLYARRRDIDRSLEILKVSSNASILSGASLTGAFDDAAASLLGGLVLTDNAKFKLLGHESINREYGSIVKILVPLRKKKLTSSLNLSSYNAYRNMSLEAVRFAREGVLVQAMLMNSIIHSLVHHYSLEPVVSSILEGANASGITGKGPAVAAVCSSSRVANRVSRHWLESNPDCKVITTSIVQPSIEEDE